MGAKDQAIPNLKFLLIKPSCFAQVWSDYNTYCRTSPPPHMTWDWRHFLTWAQTAYPGQIKTSYDFVNEVILTAEWILVQDVLIDAKDDPDEDPPSRQEG